MVVQLDGLVCRNVRLGMLAESCRPSYREHILLRWSKTRLADPVSSAQDTRRPPDLRDEFCKLEPQGYLRDLKNSCSVGVGCDWVAEPIATTA